MTDLKGMADIKQSCIKETILRLEAENKKLRECIDYAINEALNWDICVDCLEQCLKELDE